MPDEERAGHLPRLHLDVGRGVLHDVGLLRLAQERVPLVDAELALLGRRHLAVRDPADREEAEEERQVAVDLLLRVDVAHELGPEPAAGVGAVHVAVVPPVLEHGEPDRLDVELEVVDDAHRARRAAAVLAEARRDPRDGVLGLARRRRARRQARAGDDGVGRSALLVDERADALPDAEDGRDRRRCAEEAERAAVDLDAQRQRRVVVARVRPVVEDLEHDRVAVEDQDAVELVLDGRLDLAELDAQVEL